ncbi:unnamed protein product, partial [Menidia menidia]
VRSDAVLLGGTALLPCDFSQSTEDHAQISWQRKTKGKPLVDNFFVIESATKHNYVNGGDNRFKFIGDFPKRDGTLQLSNVTLMDEGTYTCIFTFFNSGNLRKEVSLTVFVPPSTSLKAEEIFEGDEEVHLASCAARGAKPRALVRWDTTNIQETLRFTNSTTPHENGTVTTVSSLFGIPTQNITARPVRCIVTSEALREELVLPLTLQINFPPLNTLISERSDDFECISEANPSASITWRKHSSPNSLRKELSLSKPVSAEGATLSFLKKKSDLQGLFECEAKNRYGSQTAYLYVHLHSDCWTYGIGRRSHQMKAAHQKTTHSD